MNGTMYPKTMRGDAINKGDEYGDISMAASPSQRATGGGTHTPAPNSTGSKNYPKGAAISKDASRLNPRNTPATDKYVGGVD